MQSLERKGHRFRVVGLCLVALISVAGIFAALSKRPYQNPPHILSADSLPVTATSVLNLPATQQVIQLPTSDYLSSAGPSINRVAPNFSLPALDGTEVKLSDFQGQLILLNFWTSWCGPCRLEAPDLARAYRTYNDKGFTILGINQIDQDNLVDVQAYQKEFDLPYPILLDQDGDVSNEAYHMLGVPMSVLINRQGMVSAVKMGGLTRDQIDQLVLEALKS